MIASHVVDKGTAIPESRPDIGRTIHFVGCGAAYRRNAFLASGGYVPLAVAYGMEEVDLCLRLSDRGEKIYLTRWLRVFHDNDLTHHGTAGITAGSIANIALLVFLRYPLRYWPYGAMQLANRIAWLVRFGRVRGIITGLFRIPGHLWRHRGLREPVSVSTLRAFLRSRREPVAFEFLSV